jgi:hypothetical protein
MKYITTNSTSEVGTEVTDSEGDRWLIVSWYNRSFVYRVQCIRLVPWSDDHDFQSTEARYVLATFQQTPDNPEFYQLMKQEDLGDVLPHE